MALSDPFGTTYEGTRQALGSYGQMGQQLGATVGDIEKKQQTMQMLQQMGILKPNELSLKDLQGFAKEHGIDVPNVTTQSEVDATGKQTLTKVPKTEEEARNLIKTIADKLGLQLPQAKGYTWDWNKAAEAGMQLNPQTGETLFHPVKPVPAMGIYTTNPDGSIKKTGEAPKGSKIMNTQTNTLTEDDVKSLGKQLADGILAPAELPGFGVGRARALSEARKINPNYNPKQADIDFYGQKIGTNNLQRLATNLIPAENTFSKNADLMLKISDEYSRTQSPALNKALLVFRGQAEGDKDTSRIIAAAWATASEYAKLVTNNGFSGNLTDTAREEVEHLLTAAQNTEQVQGLLNPDDGVMRVEAKNRISGLQDAMTAYNIPATSQGTQVAQAAGTLPKNQSQGIQEGQTATNSKTNEKMIYRGGKWQKM